MKSIDDEIVLLKSIIKGIAAHFGGNCEVVLHDLKDQPYDSTIIAIENGHVTGRKVGDCGTNLGLTVLRGTDRECDKYNYPSRTRDGKMLRSTSVYIRDDNQQVIGSICINYDISDFLMAERTLETITNSNLENEVKEHFTNDVSDLLDILIQESFQHVGIPVSLMSKEDKLKGLKYLDDKGTFLIKKSGDKVARFYDISKFTLYNYLEEARNGK